MMKKRGVTLIAASVVVAIGLAGCSQPVATPTGGTTSPTSAAPTTASPVQLTMWTFKQSHVAALEAVGAQCFAGTNVTLKVEAVTPDDTFTTKVQASVQTHDLPDLLAVHSRDEDWRFAQAGILADITDLFNTKFKDRFNDNTLNAMALTQQQIDARGDDPATTIRDLKVGSVYSVPLINGAANVVFANKKLLEAAGVDASKPPATWEQWAADAVKVKTHDPNNGGIVTAYQIPGVAYLWFYDPMVTAYMGFDAYQGRMSKAQTPAWNSRESVHTLELWDMLTPAWANGVFNLGIDPADQAFAQGKAAYDLGGTFTLPFLIQQGMSLDDLLVFQAPAPTGSVIPNGTMTTNPLVSTAITTTSTHRVEAEQYLDCLSSPAGAATFTNVAADLASPKVDPGAVQSDALKALAALFDHPGVPVLNAPWTFSPLTTGDASNQAFELLGKIAAGQETPQSVADQLTKVYKDAWAAEK